MNKKNWEMVFDIETSNPAWGGHSYNGYYHRFDDPEDEKRFYVKSANELKPFKATIKFIGFDKTYSFYKDVNIDGRKYYMYNTDLQKCFHLFKNGELSGMFEYVNKNGNIGIRYCKNQ